MGTWKADNKDRRGWKDKIMALVDDLIARFQEQQEAANAANEQRFQQGLQIFDQIIDQFKDGGSFLEATEAQLQRAGTKSVAKGTQALVSSGLAGTTQVGGLQKKFEEEVGAPTRLRAQDIAAQRTGEALSAKAGFIERREDTGPDFATIASLAKSIGAGQQAQTGNFSDGSGLRKPTSFTSVNRPTAHAPRRAAHASKFSF